MNDNPMNELDLSILEPLLADPQVTEIMVNGLEPVYVVHDGQLQETAVKFASEDEIVTLAQGIAASVGRVLDAQNPIMDVRLPDASRVNAVLRPVALTGPTLTFTKVISRSLTWDELIGYGSVSPKLLDFLRACVGARLNMVISGGTSAGKTTILNAMAAFFAPDERVITAETTAELQLDHKHLIALEAQPADRNGLGAITMTDLVRNARRMRAERIITGEVETGSEAWEMLQAMSLGYEGSMFSIHANDTQDVIDRLELMLTASTGLPLLQIRARIAQGIHIIAQQLRMSDGKRRIVSVAAVTGLTNNVIETQDIFRFVVTGEDDNGRFTGEFRATGYVPAFADKLDLPENFFVG